MSTEARAGSNRTVETDVPARPDRFPWSAFGPATVSPWRTVPRRQAIAAGPVKPLPRGQHAPVEPAREAA